MVSSPYDRFVFAGLQVTCQRIRMSQYENNMNMLCHIETVFEGGIFFLLGKEMLNKLPSGMMMRS